MKKYLILPVILIYTTVSVAQQVEWNSARILLEIQKLGTTGSVLYIAAHPDDENTRLITYLANEKKVRTGYLSLTRGDGGQNLVGEEQGAYLGVIRTQELLAARKVDGGEQFFTRAVDFGYSKSAAETFSKWPHDSLLADVVWVIRNFRPDIIITRFPADERAGHGQHTVSAIIAEEAFDAAADPTKFPEQLKYVSVWQAQRLFWNNSLRWDETLPEKIKNGDKNVVGFDVGGYNVLLGKSYGEIAAESRTNHKSQGFGSTPTRGEQIEYLYLIKGNPVESNTDLLADIPTTWERYRQGSEIKIELDKVIAAYDIQHPEKSVDGLLFVYALLEKMPFDQLVAFKKQQLQNILVACLGLWLEPVVIKQIFSSGEQVKVISTSLKRSDYPIVLESIKGFQYSQEKTKVGEILPAGIAQVDTFEMTVPFFSDTSPFWLTGNESTQYAAMFEIKNQLYRANPENEDPWIFIYLLKIGDYQFEIKRKVVFKETDAVKGEIYKPISLLPGITGSFTESIKIVQNENDLFVDLVLTCHAEKVKSTLLLEADDTTCITEPTSYLIDMIKDEVKSLRFRIVSAQAEKTVLEASWISRTDTVWVLDGNTYEETAIIVQTHSYLTNKIEINHDHIPEQIIYENTALRLMRINSPIPTLKIGYIEGAGDKVDESLMQLGLNVTTIKPEQITADELKKYDAVVIGVRAYNTSQVLADNQALLMNYVNEGGLVIAQYSTSWDSYAEQIGPYKFKIGRGRVTDENSPVDFLLADHPVLNYPNKITNADFEGWVQERGIYFATDLSPEYKAPLAFTDPGEQPQNGSLIIADYGKGAFMYTGIAFFRELPAGVPGAYRLFVNLLSYKKS